jgi:hypothetical protein
VLFDLLLQASSIRPLVLVHTHPVPQEQEGGRGRDVIGGRSGLPKRRGVIPFIEVNLQPEQNSYLKPDSNGL